MERFYAVIGQSQNWLFLEDQITRYASFSPTSTSKKAYTWNYMIAVTMWTSLICYVTNYFNVNICLINVLGTGKLKENSGLVNSVTNEDYRSCVNNRGIRVVNMNLMLVIPLCLPNIYKYKNISQNTTALILCDYYLWATCFDSPESSSDPLKNKSNVI